jgi:hypothetical protein
MKPGRINKRDRQAEQLRKKRLQDAPARAAAAKVPPRPIVVAARRPRPSGGASA